MTNDPLEIAFADLGRASVQVDSLRAQLRHAEEQADEFVNAILDQAPEEWDDDAAAESIAVDFVAHLTAEVQRLGGCLKRWCPERDEAEPEPCDHGYRSTTTGAA
jgi:hypothetical protein